MIRLPESSANDAATTAFFKRDLFSGLPVQTSEMLVDSIEKVKRWKRLNRPDKVRRRTITMPSNKIYVMGNQWNLLSRQPKETILMHPKMAEKLQRRIGGKGE